MKTIARPVKTVLAAVATLLLLTSCSEKKPEADAAAAPAREAKVLRLLSWSDYFDPEVLTAYEEKTGTRVEYLTFSDLDDAFAKLRSQPGYYDVVVTDNSALEEFWELRLIDRLDHSRIPNFENIDPKFASLPFDPQNEFSVPYLWGTTLVAYRTDLVEDPASSWSLLWDDRLKGRVMVMIDRVESLSVALMTLGYSLNSDDPREINEATGKLIDQITRVDARYGDDAAVRAGLDDGTLWAAMCYSGDAAMVAADNENVAFFIPKEGAPLWIDNFAIVRDTNQNQEAHDFINYMIGAEVAAANSNYTYYASPNRSAVPFIDEELLADQTINPPQEVLDRCEFFDKSSMVREDLTNAAWLRVQRYVDARDRDRKDGAPSTATAAPPKP